ncbi:hypothetical protein NDU88_003222 [Pleurodeles waltl]|uniref:Uncharacterized protein n=1 Tax=Pleurodeles waltl TaxID=8319 RepID=A0AAV7UD44_PLEWA|nr:hypothetical protein NDU88_003222 [Pleurodeles waltl]
MPFQWGRVQDCCKISLNSTPDLPSACCPDQRRSSAAERRLSDTRTFGRGSERIAEQRPREAPADSGARIQTVEATPYAREWRHPGTRGLGPAVPAGIADEDLRLPRTVAVR